VLEIRASADKGINEFHMHAPENLILDAGWETSCYVIPCILLLIAVTFRLDGLFAGLGRRAGRLNSKPGFDGRGQPVPRDPDGHLF
jgi:hypothetical protein